jgi:hypothetical protein
VSCWPAGYGSQRTTVVTPIHPTFAMVARCGTSAGHHVDPGWLCCCVCDPYRWSCTVCRWPAGYSPCGRKHLEPSTCVTDTLCTDRRFCLQGQLLLALTNISVFKARPSCCGPQLAVELPSGRGSQAVLVVSSLCCGSTLHLYLAPTYRLISCISPGCAKPR